MTNVLVGGYGFLGVPKNLFNCMPSSSLHSNTLFQFVHKKCIFLIMTIKFMFLAKIFNYYLIYLSFLIE